MNCLFLGFHGWLTVPQRENFTSFSVEPCEVKAMTTLEFCEKSMKHAGRWCRAFLVLRMAGYDSSAYSKAQGPEMFIVWRGRAPTRTSVRSLDLSLFCGSSPAACPEAMA